MSGNRSGRHSLRRDSQGARVTVSSAVTRSGRAGGGPRTQRPEDTRGRLAGGTEARCYTRSPGAAPSRPRAPPRSRSRRVPRVRALLSVANRDGIGPFARDLLELGVEVFATDGTREVLAPAGVAAAPAPAYYPQVRAELRTRGQVSAELRQRLAAEAFAAVAAYNAE